MAFGNATKGYVKKHSGGGGGGGTTNYSELTNKPQINGVTLDGNKTSEELNISGGLSFTHVNASDGSVTIPNTFKFAVINLGDPSGNVVSAQVRLTISITNNSISGKSMLSMGQDTSTTKVLVSLIRSDTTVTFNKYSGMIPIESIDYV